MSLNNYGASVYRHGYEDTDPMDGTNEEVFRESDSTFFCRVRDLFADELKEMYNTLESKNAWHAESFLNEIEAWQNEFPEELWRLDTERKYIRFEVFSSGKKTEEPREFSITVINRGNESVIKASSNETVLCAFERAGIEVPARCHTGECGFCRSKLVSGKIYIPEGEDKRRIADMQFNFIHPCCCYPESDLIIRIN